MKRSQGLILALALASGCVPGARAAECKEKLDSLQGYKVRSIRIKSLLWFFPAARFGFDQLPDDLPLKLDPIFNEAKLSKGNEPVGEYIRSLAGDSFEKVKVIVVVGKAENCDHDKRELDVVYHVFTNEYRPSLSHSFEQRLAEVQRPATTGAEEGSKGRFLIKPVGGYDHSLHGYGGLDISARTPLSDIKTLQFHTSVSPNSTDDRVAFAGSWLPNRTGLEHAEWQLGLRYFDLPAGSAKLKEGTVAAQFIGSTKELTQQGLTLRFGGYLDGGHQQSAGVGVGPALPPNSSLGSLKLFAGTTARLESQSFAASYGIQLGSTFNGGGLDFTKHVLDLGYTVRLLRNPKLFDPPRPGVHRPWDIEFHASAGLIQNHGVVPVTERFYGGTQPLNFIGGNDWIIPTGATIRSFPANRLGGLGPGGTLGGTRFYSANATLAKVLWGRPLLPTELSQDRSFPGALRFAVETSQGKLGDTYKDRNPIFQTAAAAAKSDLEVLVKELDHLSTELDRLASTLAGNPELAGGARESSRQLAKFRRSADAVQNGETSAYPALLHSQPRMFDEKLEPFINHLKASGHDAEAGPVEEKHSAITKALRDLTNVVDSPKLQEITKAAQDQAALDFSPVRKVLHSFLYELNIYSIAPVAVFDVARVWPTNTGVRYGVGGGVRLSLVNVNFTVGYAANPARNPGEPSGALFAKLDITSLFH